MYAFTGIIVLAEHSSLGNIPLTFLGQTSLPLAPAPAPQGINEYVPLGSLHIRLTAAIQIYECMQIPNSYSIALFKWRATGADPVQDFNLVTQMGTNATKAYMYGITFAKIFIVE